MSRDRYHPQVHRRLWTASTRYVVFCLLGIAQAQLAEQQSLPIAPDRRVATITDPGDFSSPSIAINPANPRQIVIGFQPNVTASYSTDGGEHWGTPQGTAPTNYKSSGDVSVTYDRQGHAILCFIAFDGAGSWRYWGHNPKRNGILVRRSLDGGMTWEPRAI